MIPRIIPMQYHVAERPLRSPDRVARSAFERGPHERPLRVFLDSEGCTSPLIDSIRNLAGNAHLHIEEIRSNQIEFHADGRTTLTRSSRQTTSHYLVPARHNLDAIRSWGFQPPDEPNIEARLAIAMGLAGSVGCDAFVTGSAGLCQIARTFARESNALTPEAALSVIGLHLRLREEFIVQEGEARFETDGPSFYWLVANDLVPEARLWIGCCPGTDVLLGPSIAGLARAIPARVSRALRARDRMQGYLLRVPSDATMDEALFYFDGLLVALAGAFDAAARVANRVYEVDARRTVSWRHERWREQLLDIEPSLAPVLDQAFLDAIDLLFLLRNTVHDETFQLIGMLRTNGEVAEYHASVPEADRRRLLEAGERLGGLEQWGLISSEATDLSFDLGRYVEKLLPTATRTLNAIMAAIDVERLDGTGTDVASALDDWERRMPMIRLLAGVG